MCLKACSQADLNGPWGRNLAAAASEAYNRPVIYLCTLFRFLIKEPKDLFNYHLMSFQQQHLMVLIQLGPTPAISLKDVEARVSICFFADFAY